MMGRSQYGGRTGHTRAIGLLNWAINARSWKESKMKKLMILALASSAMVATPAAAESSADVDAIGAYEVTADVESYCLFGQDDNRWAEAQTNVVVADGNFSQQFAGADGAVQFDIQSDDNTVQAAQATYVIDRAICNEAFNVTIKSDKGGLKTLATTSDDDFTSLVGYNVRELRRYDRVNS
jgi:hypothetical protein